MDKRLSAAAIALAASVGFASGRYSASPEDAVAPPDLQTEQLMEHADTDCVAYLRRHDDAPRCRVGESRVSGELAEGWLCNSAWMPPHIQECLDDALGAMVE